MAVILFSPVGGTDPISNSNCRDGSMLHIVRHFRPDIIHLYLTKEMLDHQKEDNRYLYCLEKLFELQHRENVDIREFQRPDLTEVHDFNFFYQEFRQLLENIIQTKAPEDTLLVNVSSGTPAMKAALMSLVTLLRRDCQAIQVITPDRSQNIHDNSNYDVITLWELDPDNLPESENRSGIATLPALWDLQMEAILRSNLSVYDYAAAGETAKALPPHKFNAVKDLISMAQNRYLLNYSEVDRLIRTTGYDCIPIKSGSIRPVFEYALGVEIRLKREEYADYVRSWSPLIYSLMKAYVKKLGINIDDFTYINSNGVRCISESKLNRKPDLYRVLMGSYNSSGQPSFLSSRHMVLIIQAFGKSPDEISIFEKLRIAEESIRNKAAHEVIAITARDILSATGLTAGQIMNLFKKATRLIDDHANEEAWKSYDCLNEYIIQALEQG